MWSLVALLCYGLVTSSSLSLPEEEILALADFYNSTNGQHWMWFPTDVGSKWNISNDGIILSDPCTDMWQGIDCSCITPSDPFYAYSYYYYDTSYANDTTTVECTITAINLPLFNLSGTIPPTFSLLRNLSFLHLPANSLSGRIFDVIVPALDKLRIIGLSRNHFTGSIPDSISQLTELKRLVIRQNQFSGTLPSGFSALSLYALDIQNNLFVGSLPDIFTNSPDLSYLDVVQNYLSGSIPYMIDPHPSLWYAVLGWNEFTGPLPDFSLCEGLNILQLGHNHFTGDMNLEVYANISTFVVLGFESTQAAGTLPNDLHAWNSMRQLDVSDSLLYGTIPEGIGSLSEMRYLYLSQTLLTGSIPSSIGALSLVKIFELTDTRIGGSIPSSIGGMLSLQVLSLYSNQLTGTIPPEMSSLEFLVFCMLQNNALSGPIPRGLFSLPLIEVVQLQQNHLESISPDPIFLNDSSLRAVDLSNNRLRSTIPVEIFESEALKVFVAAKNCFDDLSLEAVCQAVELQTFSLDGANQACRQESTQHYDLPPCLLGLPNLQLLHLSGVGLVGKIPSVPLSPALRDLSLSHNVLTGTIPSSIQRQQWELLDLSFNKLMGTVSRDLQPSNGTIVLLEVNRLSGSIPSALRNADDISILDGNIFACELVTRNSLPTHDPDRDIYSCGSNSLDSLLYAWFGCFVVFVVWTLIQPSSTPLRSWIQWSQPPTDGKEVASFLFILRCARVGFVRGGAIISFLFLPLYLVLNHFWRTYTYTYAFQVSAIYLAGLIPAVILAVTWLSMLVAVGHISRKVSGQVPHRNAHLSFRELFRGHFGAGMRFIVANALAFLLLTVYIVAVNIGFVYSQMNYSPEIAIYCQIALAAIKLLTNHLLIPFILHLTFRHARVTALNASKRDQAIWFRRVQLSMEIALAIVSNIIAPCIGTAVSSSHCYYHAIFPPPLVHTSYSIERCDLFLVYIFRSEVFCLDYRQDPWNVSFHPPFEYSYQCSAFLIASYTSVYVYMYLLNSFVRPALRAIIVTVMGHLCASLRPGSNVSARSKRKSERIFDKDDFVMEFVVGVAILLSFGLLYPPLGFIAAFYMVTFLKDVESKVEEAQASPAMASQLAKLRRDFAVVAQDLHENLQNQVLPVVVAFCGYFTLDVLGDAYGLGPSLALGLGFIAAYHLLYRMLGCLVPVHPHNSVAPTSIVPTGKADTEANSKADPGDDNVDDIDEKEETLYDLLAILVGAFFAF